MPNFKLIVEYDGTHFNGWQIQGGKERTVQGELQKACRRIFGKKLTIIGSGRTDAGVHAKAQVASVKIETKLTEGQIRAALNAHLPEDIAVINVEKAKDDFHAQFDARSKTYRYTIYNGRARSALMREFCAHYPYPVNLSRMKKEAQTLVGRHDFRSFQASDALRQATDTTRTIKRLEIKKKGELITIDIEADGFLYKMVRNIVGTLLYCGSGKLPEGAIKKILLKKDRNAAGKTAPACGLCLMEVRY
jgi:tRNA pseudouridine38-40 synthase